MVSNATLLEPLATKSLHRVAHVFFGSILFVALYAVRSTLTIHTTAVWLVIVWYARLWIPHFHLSESRAVCSQAGSKPTICDCCMPSRLRAYHHVFGFMLTVSGDYFDSKLPLGGPSFRVQNYYAVGRGFSLLIFRRLSSCVNRSWHFPC